MTSRLSLSRRSVFKTVGLAVGALAAPQIMTRAALAQTPAVPAGADAPRFNRIKLGDFEVTTLFDGARVMDKPHEIFGTDQQPEAVAALLQENLLPVERALNSFSPVLVRAGNDLILFDTGTGEGGRETGQGQMVAAMQAAGHQPGDITIVALTHFHGDHIGGLMEGGQPAFPNARYVAGKTEYDFWTDEARIGTPQENGHKSVIAKVAPLAEKMTFIGDGEEVVGGITGMDAFGHSPGHMIFMVESGNQRVLLTADTANHFVLSLQRPDWQVRFDMDKAMGAETRKRVFDMVAAERVPFIGYHMPFPALAYVEKLDTGYRYVPETYQFDI
jgi:glyoxylase-like metal-dependent hydrolase (beta-lactamase superfamily II)